MKPKSEAQDSRLLLCKSSDVRVKSVASITLRCSTAGAMCILLHWTFFRMKRYSPTITSFLRGAKAPVLMLRCLVLCATDKARPVQRSWGVCRPFSVPMPISRVHGYCRSRNVCQPVAVPVLARRNHNLISRANSFQICFTTARAS
jgi:hypothetical protein